MDVTVRHLLPLSSETQWSDLLATVIECAPDVAADVFGIPGEDLAVRRESRMEGRDRIDVRVDRAGQPVAGIEVKVLSGLGPRQLTRYEQATASEVPLIVVYPARLVVDVAHHPRWRALTWEQVLTAFAASDNEWVAATARAALLHLDSALPKVDADTRWGDLRDGSDFVLELRARASWIFSQLHPPSPVKYDQVESSAGVSWVNRLYVRTPVPNHWAMAEVEERLPVRDFPKWAGQDHRRPLGPSVKLGLAQFGVKTSAGFDWQYLLDAWQVMAAARTDWVTHSANPRSPHDREAWERMVARGGPRYLGVGFGDAEARRSGGCQFGARLQLPPDTRLSTVVETMQSLAPVLTAIADLRRPA